MLAASLSRSVYRVTHFYEPISGDGIAKSHRDHGLHRTSREISTGLNKSAERALTPGFTALDIYRVTVGFLGKALAVIWRSSALIFAPVYFSVSLGVERGHPTGRL
jgi:hypothetical protein